MFAGEQASRGGSTVWKAGPLLPIDACTMTTMLMYACMHALYHVLLLRLCNGLHRDSKVFLAAMAFYLGGELLDNLLDGRPWMNLILI